MVRNIGGVLLCAAVVFLAAGPALAEPNQTPKFNLDNLPEWEPVGPLLPLDLAPWSLDNPYMSPIPDWMDWDPEPYDIQPLFVYEGGESSEGPGLVMSWGDSPPPNDGAAAWKHVYPKDPDVIGQVLTARIAAPQFAAGGSQVDTVSLALVDAAGMSRVWTWVCGGAADGNTIVWNQEWDLTIGPIAGPVPPELLGPAVAVDTATGLLSAAPSIYSNPAFNPATVVEVWGLASGSWVSGATDPTGTTVGAWMWWDHVSMTPEPASLTLLAAGVLLLLRRRRS